MIGLCSLLAIGACVHLALRARRGERDAQGELLAVLIVGLLIGFSFFTKNVRHVAVLDFPIRALAVWVLWELLGARRRLGVAVCALAVVALCVADVWSFLAFFVEAQIYDPASLYLLSLRGMVPLQ